MELNHKRSYPLNHSEYINFLLNYKSLVGVSYRGGIEPSSGLRLKVPVKGYGPVPIRNSSTEKNSN